MEVRSSLRSLKHEGGPIVVRRHGKVFVVDERSPRWQVRQG